MSADRIDKMYLMIKALERQNITQSIMIEELKKENKLIIEKTTKMGNHIDFINGVYEKLTKSYIFRYIFT
jgi:hypothetical protein